MVYVWLHSSQYVAAKVIQLHRQDKSNTAAQFICGNLKITDRTVFIDEWVTNLAKFLAYWSHDLSLCFCSNKKGSQYNLTPFGQSHPFGQT